MYSTLSRVSRGARIFQQGKDGHLPSPLLTTLTHRTVLSTSHRSLATSHGGGGPTTEQPGGEERHPDAEKEPLPEWPKGVNPDTGEKDGPRGPEPTRFGDWERKGRVSDF